MSVEEVEEEVDDVLAVLVLVDDESPVLPYAPLDVAWLVIADEPPPPPPHPANVAEVTNKKIFLRLDIFPPWKFMLDTI